MNKTLNFDSECLVLARHFLQGEADYLALKERELANAIQDAVESWFEREERT